MENIVPDIPRFFTAIAEWAACMVYILNMRKRLKGRKFYLTAGGSLLVQTVFLTLTGNVKLYLWFPCMVIAVLLMIGFIFVCCSGDWKDSVYIGLQAFVLAEFAASLEWQLDCFFLREKKAAAASLLMMIVIYAALYFFYGWLLSRQQTKNEWLNVTAAELAAAGLIAVSVFAVSNLSFISSNTPFSATYWKAVVTIRTMVDLGGVAMMYAHYVQRFQIHIKQELAILQNVLQSQYLQYERSRESIDLINYKYHDLKHQIAVLREEEDPQKRSAFLDRMEEEIHQYETQNKTGNKVLDAMLTSKNVICDKYGISLNCVADGKLLDFVDVMDLCTILGNALDNAIECEKKIPDREKRLIHMAIFSQKDFLIMRFENYFEGELKLLEGVPQTTKTKKTEFHGYGIKSIRHTVKKYGGAASINVQDQWFELKVLIPIPKKK